MNAITIKNYYKRNVQINRLMQLCGLRISSEFLGDAVHHKNTQTQTDK